MSKETGLLYKLEHATRGALGKLPGARKAAGPLPRALVAGGGSVASCLKVCREVACTLEPALKSQHCCSERTHSWPGRLQQGQPNK